MTDSACYTMRDCAIRKGDQLLFVLVRAKWGDDAPSHDELAAAAVDIAAIINGNAAPRRLTADEFEAQLRALPLGSYNAVRAELIAKHPNNPALMEALRRVDGSCTGG